MKDQLINLSLYLLKIKGDMTSLPLKYTNIESESPIIEGILVSVQVVKSKYFLTRSESFKALYILLTAPAILKPFQAPHVMQYTLVSHNHDTTY